MLYFKINNNHLVGVPKRLLENMNISDIDKLITDKPQEAELKVHRVGLQTIWLEVSNYLDYPNFYANIQLESFVKIVESDFWKSGKYIGRVSFIKKGAENFVIPIFD